MQTTATNDPIRPALLSIVLWSVGLGVVGALAQVATATPTEDHRTHIELPRITVQGQREVAFEPLNTTAWAGRPGAAFGGSDSAELLRAVPGAAVVRNGPQTGIVQLRGLSGDRVRVAVDGMTLTPACPNHMDPPLHYLSPSSLDTLSIMAGITPVSQGGDSLGGAVIARSAPPRFSTNNQSLYFGEAGVGARTGNDGLMLEGRAGVADRTVSLSYDGSWRTARDYRYPDGRVSDTTYDTQQHLVQVGTQTQAGLIAADLGWLRTRDTGTPTLPMDMIRDDGLRLGLQYENAFPFGTVEGRLYHHEVEHLMDNYHLRPPGRVRMFSPATSDDTGLRLGVALPCDRHTMRTGIEGHGNRFDAYQENAATGQQQDTLNRATRDHLGAYVEWLAAWSPCWETQLGVRLDTVASDAQDIEHSFPPAAADRAAFNAEDHDFTEVNIDATASLRWRPHAHATFELGVARKNRAPSLLERYLWTPLSASAGQADGRTYLGQLTLASETAHLLALTMDGHGTNWQIQVTPFYNYITDYIQGTAIDRLDANGQNVLQFQNQDAVELYGVDASARYQPIAALTVRGTLSYVRGRNLDTDDNLYRIAPLRGTVALDARWGLSLNTIDVVLVNRQEAVARYNQEPPTPGYALLNLRTTLQLTGSLELELGLENVLDTPYADHLGGINRVSGGDVGVGQRLPGMGRSLYVMARAKF
jgi:iron complex outermembrane receptor protein